VPRPEMLYIIVNVKLMSADSGVLLMSKEPCAAT